VQQLQDAAAAISPAEWTAVALALAYLVLAVRQHIACWIFAASSSAIFLVIFAHADLVMQSALQALYIAMAAYGWYSWRGGVAASRHPRSVTRWSGSRHLLLIAGVAVAAAANGWLLRSRSAGAVPYVDALVAWGSVLATWMVARKVLENWLYWIALDLLAAALYWTQGLHATAMLFVLYSLIAVQGYRSWRSTLGVESTRPMQACQR
jgi:nicotinamide mononucleotide transporter